MHRDYRKNKLFHRRAFILTAIRSFLGGLLIFRLGYLQIGKHKEYSTKSDKNRIKTTLVPSLRGVVFDRNQKILVKNRKNYRLILHTQNKLHINNTIKELSNILDLDSNQTDQLLQKISKNSKKPTISLIDNLSWNDLAKIEVNSYKIPSISIEKSPVRHYPLPFATAHIIGYVSTPSEKEITIENQNLFMHPNFKIGKRGIEKSFDEYLRGQFGIKHSEINAFGVNIRDISEKDSIKGQDLSLTIDADLQKFIFDKISNKTASAVVMNVKTGEILSMVSTPSFNSNNFIEGFSQEYWQELTTNIEKPLNNKPITANYPPGSVFKLIVALAALEHKINPKKKIRCNGKHRLGNRIFHCWKDSGHGLLDMQGAIKHSCNIYFFNLAKELGIDNITQIAKKFGYGEIFDLDLQKITIAELPSDNWKKRIFNEKWVGGDTLNTAIGQGFMLASPIQITVATARIANGGIRIIPHIIKNKNLYTQYQALKEKPITSKENIEYIRKSMYNVVNERNGTAYYSRIKNKDFKMAGKTGTSQVISKREKNMTEEEKRNNKNHALFTAFAPFHDPKYAITVVIEHEGSGSRSAAPIAKDILEKIQELKI